MRVAKALERAGGFWSYESWWYVSTKDGKRQRRALDFVVFVNGVIGILQGDGFPRTGRATYDHATDRAFKMAGLWVIERYPSKEAYHDPDRVVRRFLGLLTAYRRTA